MTRLDLTNCLILDTETTGIGDDDEIIELAIIRTDNGEVLFNQRFKPTKTISDEAFAIHGISDDELVDKPRYAAYAPKLQGLLAGKTVIGWNIDFDIRLLRQTALAQRCALTWLEFLPVFDYKAWYVKRHFLTADDSHLWDCCVQANIKTEDLTAHRAWDDCQLLYRLIHQ